MTYVTGAKPMKRARAYTLTGDAFAEELCCVWEPKRPVTGGGAGTRPVEQILV